MQASPSKARAQALESHSWSIVTDWLSSLYHPSPVPGFERNASTLKALQSLMRENIAADCLQELLFAAKYQELVSAAEGDGQQQEEEGAGLNQNALRIINLLGDSLSRSAEQSLESLSSSAVLLGLPTPSSSSDKILQRLLLQILNVPRRTFDLEDHISAIDVLTASLRRDTNQTIDALSTFRKEKASFTDVDDTTDLRPSTPVHPADLEPLTDYSQLHAQILQHQRETKQLLLKSDEYKTRIDALRRQLAATQSAAVDIPSMAALVSKRESLDDKKTRLNKLETRFNDLHGLPPDIEASRLEVQRAQSNLDALKRRRDEMFEAI